MPAKIGLVEFVARMEGFGASPFNRATRNNNPGDIEWGDFARAHGATRIEQLPPHRTPRFAYFPTPELGYEAERALLKTKYKGYSLTSFYMEYAPPSENDTKGLIDKACRVIGCGPNDVIDGIL